MADDVNPQVPSVVPPGASAVAPVAPAAPAAGAPPDPAWLNPRLEQAKNSAREALLKELGVTDLGAAKAAFVAAEAARNASKTAEQRAAELETQIKATQSNEQRLQAAVTEYAARQMVGLTPEQKAAVDAIAGTDPALQMKAITALAPTWAAAATVATSAAPAQAGASVAVVKPANTAPGATAPAPADAVSPPDHKAVYTAMAAVNPFAAAAYAEQHFVEVYTPKT